MDDYIYRVAEIDKKLEKKSLFLFGPRQTGKSSYIRNQLREPRLSWSLLDNELYRNLSMRPSLLRNTLRAKGINDGIVVIDEIQRLPDLLNEVHMLIEETDIHFLLTGSSARKLKKKGVNLLGGRAGKLNFHPLVWPEITDYEITIDKIFRTGLLPAAFSDDDCDSLLNDYVGLYVKEEIEAEREIRNLPPFWEFLRIAATESGEITNYENVARDVGISGVSVREWYNILIDTLIGFEVPPYRKTKLRKPNASSKFYLFDVGVTRKLQGLSVIEEGTTEFGRYFENYIAMEIRSFLDYSGLDKEGLHYWHAQSGQEVDFIIKEKVAVEVKATKHVSPRDLKGLKALMEEGLMEKYILVCREDYPQLLDNGILILPYKDFLSDLWGGRIL
ncbi:MAG: AAA family ATPase [Spirochaetales bacterium]|nr:AAA family ATPase [Spirochaetales bacterium]